MEWEYVSELIHAHWMYSGLENTVANVRYVLLWCDPEVFSRFLYSLVTQISFLAERLRDFQGQKYFRSEFWRSFSLFSRNASCNEGKRVSILVSSSLEPVIAFVQVIVVSYRHLVYHWRTKGWWLENIKKEGVGRTTVTQVQNKKNSSNISWNIGYFEPATEIKRVK